MNLKGSNSQVFQGMLTPRFTDIDTWRHINNSRVYQLHIEARTQALVHRFGSDAWFSNTERLRPLRTITQFQKMSFYGSNINFTVEVISADRLSVLIRTELYQKNILVGSQDCLLGAFLDHKQVSLPEYVYHSFRNDVNAEPHFLWEAAYEGYANDLMQFSAEEKLTPRYADLDADNQRSEAAICRYNEQARFGTMYNIDLHHHGMLIAALDMSFGHYKQSREPVSLFCGVSSLGRSSFHLVGVAKSMHGVHAISSSVMILVDLQTNRPLPIPDNIREQLETHKL